MEEIDLKCNFKVEEPNNFECNQETFSNVKVKDEEEFCCDCENINFDDQEDALASNKGCDVSNADVEASKTEKSTSEKRLEAQSTNVSEDSSLSGDDNSDDDDWPSYPQKKNQRKKESVAKTYAGAHRSLELTADLKFPHLDNRLTAAPKMCIEPSAPEGIDPDDLMHCVECSRAYKGDCPEHGPLIIIEDVPVPPDINNEFRAKRTAPPMLSVADSKIPGAGSGVWTRKVVPARVRFGPYDGEIVPVDSCSSYAWVIRKDRQPAHCVDGQEPGLSNWMRYVNCARYDGEQNLVAFQYQGKIYYRTIERIVPNKELLVWYGNDTGRLLGIDTLIKIEGFEEAKFKCPTCVYSFSSPLYLETHKKYCRQRHLMQPPSNNSELYEKRKGSTKTPKASQIRSCTKCSRKFTDEEGLMRHIKSHPNIKVLVCPECGKKFLRTGQLNVHLRRHSGDKPFVCVQCHKRFVQISHLTNHLQSHSSERPYECDECNKRFSRKAHLESHFLVHRGERKHVCRECNKGFIRNSDLTKHMETHSERPLSFSCPNCSKRFPSLGYLKKHSVIHTGEKPFACTECDQRFTHGKTLKHHLRSHFGEKPYVCTECDRRFVLSKSLLNHMKSHGEVEHFKCKECRKVYLRKASYEAHLLRHQSASEPNRCAECGEVFSRLQNLKRHLAVHFGEKPFDCEVCEEQFARKETLRKHELSHRSTEDFAFVNCEGNTSLDVAEGASNEPEDGGRVVGTENPSTIDAVGSNKPFYCSQCSEQLPHESSYNAHIKSHTKEKHSCTVCHKQYASKKSLNSHLRYHSGEKPFVCQICGRSFVQKSHLDNHTISHSSEKPFTCEICEKRFSRRGTLQSHMKLHFGEKPFPCEECGKRFSEKTALNIHLRMHSGERPFVCSECQKGFCTITLLNVHERIHTGCRPFACHECGKSFRSSGNLSTHMKSHCVEKPFVCAECDQRFSRKSNLKAHLKCHNKQKSRT